MRFTVNKIYCRDCPCKYDETLNACPECGSTKVHRFVEGSTSRTVKDLMARTPLNDLWWYDRDRNGRMFVSSGTANWRTADTRSGEIQYMAPSAWTMTSLADQVDEATDSNYSTSTSPREQVLREQYERLMQESRRQMNEQYRDRYRRGITSSGTS